jgi:MFS family permease
MGEGTGQDRRRGGKLSEFEIERSLKHSMRDSAFNSISLSFTSMFFAAFAIALGAGSFYIGMLAALPIVFWTIAQIPASRLVERCTRRKVVVVLAMAASRAVLIPLLVIPTMAQTDQLLALLGLVTASSFFAALADPAMTSWLGDLVPFKIYGVYFARRLRVSKLFEIIALVIAGLILGLYPPDGVGGFQILFMLGILFGFISLQGVIKIAEPETKIGKSKALERYYKRTPSYRRLKKFLFAFFIWQFGVMLSSPFFVVKLLDVMDAPYYWVSIHLIVMSLFMVGSQASWGRYADRFGSRAMLIITAFGSAFYPLMWIFATEPVHIIPIEIISGVFWAGFNLTYFNYLLEISPPQRRHRFSATFYMILGTAGVIGPLAGGWLAGYFAERYLFMFTQLDALFFISWVVRLAGVVLFATILEEIDIRGKVRVTHIFSEMARHFPRNLVSMAHLKERVGMKELLLSELGVRVLLNDIIIVIGSLQRKWSDLGRWKHYSEEIAYAAYDVHRGAKLIMSYAPENIRVTENSAHHEVAETARKSLEHVRDRLHAADRLASGVIDSAREIEHHEAKEIHRHVHEARQHIQLAHSHFHILRRKRGYLRLD